MVAFLTSFAFVVLAEMGDKTQLLAMAFASKYRWQTVMGAVLVATLVNHLLAVLTGTYLTAFLPMRPVQIVAAASFILFGLWTLRGDTLGGEDTRFSYSPFRTVAIAFFLAEMGDKTQLATVALGARFGSVLPVWLGTTTGMVVADAVGILAGTSWKAYTGERGEVVRGSRFYRLRADRPLRRPPRTALKRARGR